MKKWDWKTELVLGRNVESFGDEQGIVYHVMVREHLSLETI